MSAALEPPPRSLLPTVAEWLSVWGVLTSAAIVASAVIIAAEGSSEWANWIGSIGGYWLDLEQLSGWIMALGVLIIAVTGIVLLTRYRSSPAPRAVYVAGLIGGVVYLAAQAYDAFEMGYDVSGVLRHTLLPLSLLPGLNDGVEQDAVLTVQHTFYQLNALVLLAWIAVFAALAVRHRGGPVRPGEGRGPSGGQAAVHVPGAGSDPRARTAAAAHRPQPHAVPSAGWFPDPTDPGQLRYWDGASWSESVHRPTS